MTTDILFFFFYNAGTKTVCVQSMEKNKRLLKEKRERLKKTRHGIKIFLKLSVKNKKASINGYLIITFV